MGGGWHAILIITHSSKKYFGPLHVKKANRFAPLASQTLLTLELQQKAVQRDMFFLLSLDLMAIVDAEGILKQHNNVWRKLLGYKPNEVRGQTLFQFIHPEDIESIETILHFLNKKEGKELVEVRLRSERGNYLWFSCSLASHHDEQLCYFVARDINDSILFRQRLAYNSRHDSLTGLKNRGEFRAQLRQEFATSSMQKDYVIAVLFLDLNNFKTINDTLGHDIGDELLVAFAEVLKTIVHGRDTVARLGGDEFTILLVDVQSQQKVINIAEQIHEKCMIPFELNGHTVSVSTSIGIAISTFSYPDESHMLRAADQSMYQAKSDLSVKYVINGYVQYPKS